LKKLLFSIASVLFSFSLWSQCSTNVDFNTWVKGGQPGNGNWVVQGGGSQVHQTVNGNPSFYFTPYDLMNVDITGNFKSTDTDDDYMGFVFSFLNPLGATDSFDCWLYDWKQDQQNGAPQGMSINRVFGVLPPATYTPQFWNHQNSPEFTVVQNNFGSAGWNWNNNHSFRLKLTYTRAQIYIDGVLKFDVQDCFKPGRFGFYNLSQQDCYYSNFQYSLFVDYTTSTDKVCLGQPITFQFTPPCFVGSLAQYQSITWNFGDGSPNVVVSNPTSATVNIPHTYATAGVFNATVTVLDNNNCSATATHSVEARNPITLTPTLVNPLCNGGNNGNISLVPSGGFGPFAYTWNGGSNGSSNIGLTAGTYSVSVTDGICYSTAQYTLNQPTPVTATVSKTDANCGINNGTATIAISGGTPPYTGVNWGPGFPGAAATGLAPGTFIADFRDANGCSSLLQYSATIGSLPCGITSSVATTNVTCFGGSNGTATLTVTGSTAPVNITWSNGMTGASISGLAAGTYTYNYADGNASHAFSGSITITQPGAAMVATLSTIGISCSGLTNGSALASVPSGGSSPYNYSWSGGQPNNPSANNLATGPISVTVSDSRGCTATASGNISTIPPLIISLESNIDSCYHSGKGKATAHASGGNPPYSFAWSNFDVDSTSSNLISGTYIITVTDQNNCTTTSSAIIGGPAAPLVPNLVNTDVRCTGDNTGAFTLTMSGGTPGYSYNWNTGATSQNVSGLVAGNYNCTITDLYNCTVLAGDTINEPDSALTVTTSHTDVKCHGGSDGTVTINISGGTAPYTYLGNPIPAGTTTIPSLAAGTYAGNIVDNNNCSVAVSETVTEPAVQSLTLTSTNNVCFGGATATATADFVNATGLVSYNWNPGGVLPAARTGLTSGTYAVTATDANLCTVSGTTTITEPTAIVHPYTSTNINCFGNATGTITTNVSGGTPTYTYTWNPATASGATPTGLASGTYYLTISDNNSCQVFDTITLSQPAAALTVTTSHTDVKCHGGSDGTVTITISGGTAPYTYLGNPIPAGTTTIPSLAAGTYAGNIVDNNNCSVAVSETVTEPAVQSLTLTSTNNVCFGGATATATADFVNATGLVSYNWNPGGVLPATRTGLTSGTYAVTATDANLCTVSGTTTITEPTAIVHPYTSTNINCFGNATGTITTNVSGGTPTYTYTWNPATASGATPTGLASGTYYLTISDNNSCQVFDTITLTQPAAALTVTTSHTDVKCHGESDGTVTINISGGTAPYTYLGNPIPAGTTTIPSLAAGTYAGNIVDNNNCSVAVSETVTEPAVQSLTLTSTNNVCFGGATATATADFVNATGLVSYNWNPGGVLPAARTGLTSGTYDVTATDANSCTLTASTTITEPASPIMTITAIDASCFGGNGSATANPSGAGPFTFAWSNSGVGQTITPIAGTYTVTATDLALCQQTATGTINQPTAVAVTPNQVDINCFGATTGSIVLSVSGGTAAGAYNYTWSPNVSTTASASSLGAGSYAITVTDDNSCSATVTVTLAQPASALSYTVSSVDKQCNGGVNDGRIVYATSGGTAPYTFTWSANASSAIDSAINLDAGTYDVTITDSKGCSVTNSVTITQPVSPLSVLSQSQNNVSCFGGNNGSATVVAQGGTIGYSYAWTPNVSSSATASGLSLGGYSVTITDSHGCSVNTAFTITEPAALTASAVAVATTCNAGSDGSVAVNAAGGTPAAAGYVYTWNPNVSTTNAASGLIAGTYTITVSDSLACSVTASAIVTSPTAVGLTETHTNEPCFGDALGTVQLSASGGTPAYTLELENGGVYSASPNGFFNGLLAGTYNIRVTDSKGCPTTSSVTITEPSAIAIAAVFDTVKCFGESNGAISASASGGASGYSFAFSNGVTNTTGSISGLPAANYTVTVTDVNGCSTATTLTVTQPDAVEITLSPVDSLVLNLGEGQVITASSNYSDAVFNWSPATGLGCSDCNSNEIKVYNSTAYVITASTSPHGKVCSTAVRLPVTVIPNYKLYIPNAFTPNADGINDLYEIFGNKDAIKFLDIAIFNRWGEKVYESKDIFFQWDGRYKGVYLEPGVYVYTINITFLDNHSESNQRGSITILR
jgi:gliding motility-associated-like protein